jgi:hypothetical protein
MRETNMQTGDVYSELMARLKYPESELFRRVLQKLLTTEEGKLMIEMKGEQAEMGKSS